MKRLKPALATALCLALLLTLFAACKGGGQDLGNIVYGRYVEEDITPQDMKGNLNSFISFGGGALDLITTEYDENYNIAGVHRWRSADNGASWQTVDMSWTLAYYNDYSDYYERGEQPPKEVRMDRLLPMENGDTIYTIYTWVPWVDDENPGSSTTEMFRRSADGADTPFALEGMATDGTTWINDLQALPGGRLYAYTYRNPTPEEQDDAGFDWSKLEKRAVYDAATGALLYELDFEGWQLFYNSTTLYLQSYENAITAVNLADGSPSQAPMPDDMLLQATQLGYSNNMQVDDAGNFYNITAYGAKKLSPGAEEPEEIMDGLNYTYGSPLYYINGVTYNPADNTFLMAVGESRGTRNATPKLLRYVWDDKAIASTDLKLKVYSLYDNQSIRLGLSEFKRLHPEVTLEYETAMDPESDISIQRQALMVASGEMSSAGGSGGEDTAKTIEDALRALNTELLNGTGPDILILDGMPVDSFIEKGVLEDLTAQTAGNSDLLDQVIEPMKTDGKLYAVPVNFYIPTLFGDKGYLGQFTSLDALLSAIKSGAGVPDAGQMPEPPGENATEEEWNAFYQQQDAYYQAMYAPRPAEEQPVLYSDSITDIFTILYNTSAPSIFSEKDGINQQNLSSFLQAVKDVADKYQLSANSENGGGITFYGYGYAAVSSIYSNQYSATLDRFTNRQSRLGYSTLGSLDTLANVSSSLYWSANNSGKGVMPMPLDGDTQADDTAGTEPEVVVEDVDPGMKVAPGLGDGVYMPAQLLGVTSTSRQKDLSKEFISIMLGSDVQKYNMSSGLPVSRAAMEDQYSLVVENNSYFKEQGITMMDFDLDALLSELHTPLYGNEYLRSVIEKPVADFCAGGISLDTAVNQIVKETELYFAERQ